MAPIKNPANTGRAYRAYLTGGESQGQEVSRVDGCCRLVRSIAIEARQTGYRMSKATGAKYQAPKSNQLTELVRDVEWLRAVPVHALQQELRKLDRAYANFFAGRAAYPRPRSKKYGVAISFADPKDWSLSHIAGRVWEIRLPKGLGVFRFIKHRSFGGNIRSVTLTSRAGRWQLSFGVHERKPKATTKPGVVGVDRGVIVTAATSKPVDLHDGRGPQRLHNMPDLLTPSEQRRLLRLQRQKASQFDALKRRRAKAKKSGVVAHVPVSKRHLDTIHAIAAIKAREARRRRDWLRKMAHGLSEFGTVVFEDLKVKNMTASAAGTVEGPGINVAAKSGLNRSILGAGWGMLVVFTGEQTTALKVPAYNSSRECANCGHVAKANRPNRDTFICVVCHHQDHADLNASDVIEARGNRVLAGDGQPASVVARRSRKAPGTKNEEVPAHAA
jgi:putative transposase